MRYSTPSPCRKIGTVLLSHPFARVQGWFANLSSPVCLTFSQKLESFLVPILSSKLGSPFARAANMTWGRKMAASSSSSFEVFRIPARHQHGRKALAPQYFCKTCSPSLYAHCLLQGHNCHRKPWTAAQHACAPSSMAL